MGAILVLTPLVVSSWPAISAAVMGAAAAMGFATAGGASEQATRKTAKRTVETEIDHSEVLAEAMTAGQTIVLRKDDVAVEVKRDARGACTVCVTGDRHTDRQLRQIGEEVAGRIVQQFAYHKLMTELKRRHYAIVEEHVLQDQSIQVRVRL